MWSNPRETEENKFKSEVQMLLCRFLFCLFWFHFFSRSYLRRFGKLLGIFLLNLLQPAVGLKNTRTWTHTHSDLWAWYLFHMPITRQLGRLPAAPPFWSSQKTTGLVFDLTPTIHHLKSKKKKEKKNLSCQLLDKHRLLWKEKGRRR